MLRKFVVHFLYTSTILLQFIVYAWQGCSNAVDILIVILMEFFCCGCCYTLFCWKPIPFLQEKYCVQVVLYYGNLHGKFYLVSKNKKKLSCNFY